MEFVSLARVWSRRLRGLPTARLLPVAEDRSIRIPFSYGPPPQTGLRVAVMVHAFYPEMAGDLRAAFAAIDRPFDVLMTTDTDEKMSLLLEAFGDLPGVSVEVRKVPNLGRDIAPKLTAYIDRYSDYDLILFLHTKKTERGALGEAWRRWLFERLCGSRPITRSIYALFAAEPDLGMVFPQHFPAIRPYVSWDGNERESMLLAGRLGVTLNIHGTLDLPSGSMFWARPEALAPLIELGWKSGDFPPEIGQIADTPAHAVERLFLVACELSGHSWVKVDIEDGSGAGRAFIDLTSPVAIPSAISAAHARLAGRMYREK